MMNISWVIADSAELDPTQNIDALKMINDFDWLREQYGK